MSNAPPQSAQFIAKALASNKCLSCKTITSHTPQTQIFKSQHWSMMVENNIIVYVSEWLMRNFITNPNMSVICTSTTSTISKWLLIGSWVSHEVVIPNGLPCRRHRLEKADNWLPQLASSKSFLLVTLGQILRRFTLKCLLKHEKTRRQNG